MKQLAKGIVKATGKLLTVAVDQVVEEADRALSERGIDTAGVRVRAEAALVSGEDAVARATGTAIGQFATKKIATVGALVRRVPGTMLAADALHEHFDMTSHVARIRQDPADIVALIWAADALRKAERAGKAYRTVRSAQNVAAGNIVSAAAAAIVRIDAAHRSSGDVEPAELLLKRAYALAVQQAKRLPADAHALYAIARVHLLMGQPQPAIAAGSVAARCGGPNSDLAMVVCAEACRSAGELAASRAWAEAAVQAGCTLGYRVLAELVLEELNDTATLSLAKAYADLDGKVLAGDVERWSGPARSASNVAIGVAAEQVARTKSMATSSIRMFRAQRPAPQVTDGRKMSDVR